MFPSQSCPSQQPILADIIQAAASHCVQIPGRENGGNCDIKNLSKGCKVYFPVFVEGANLSMGDMHFSQVSFGRPSTDALPLVKQHLECCLAAFWSLPSRLVCPIRS